MRWRVLFAIPSKRSASDVPVALARSTIVCWLGKISSDFWSPALRNAASVASPLFRVRLNAAQLRESSSNSASDESRRIGEAVDQDRAHAVDAAIVRIMKTRRSLAHKLLARELAAQLRFAVAGPALKKRVESLIDREFLARDEADPSVYNYLA